MGFSYSRMRGAAPEADGAGAWILDGAIPDLRYMPADVHGQFLGIVLGGSHRENGMPGFAGEGAGFPLEHTIMTPEEAKTYGIIDEVITGSKIAALNGAAKK